MCSAPATAVKSERRKRLPIALILEAQDADVEFDAFLSIVHSENQMIELYSHYGRLLWRITDFPDPSCKFPDLRK